MLLEQCAPSATDIYCANAISNAVVNISRGDDKPPPSYGFYYSKETLIPSTWEFAPRAELIRLNRKLDDLSKLPLNWDGYGGRPATVQSLNDARAFIKRLPTHSRVPNVMLSGNGEISLFWEENDIYIEAAFPGGGAYHYFVDGPTGGPSDDDVQANADKLPLPIILALEAHFV